MLLTVVSKDEGFRYLSKVTDSCNPLADHVLELHFLSDLMREGVKRLDTSMDDLCERMSKLKKNGRPYGLAQRLKDIIEAEDVSVAGCTSRRGRCRCLLNFSTTPCAESFLHACGGQQG